MFQSPLSFVQRNTLKALDQLFDHDDSQFHHETVKFVSCLFELGRSLINCQQIVDNITNFLNYLNPKRGALLVDNSTRGHLIIRQIEDTLKNYRRLFKVHPTCPREALLLTFEYELQLNFPGIENKGKRVREGYEYLHRA